jgi:phosphatidylglycerophosphatase A
MVIKKSSDELNPPVATPNAGAAVSRPVRTFKDYLALAIATCGVGYLPLAPGTWGTMVGVGFYFLLKSVFLDVYIELSVNHWFSKDAWEGMPDRLTYLFTCFLLIAIIVVSLVGIWAASRTEKLIGRKDPGIVVIDEVAGILVAFISVPHFYMYGIPPIYLFAFLAFRFFDIVKPYPARRMESLPAGLGIMADDIVAGAYTAVLMTILLACSSISGILPR